MEADGERGDLGGEVDGGRDGGERRRGGGGGGAEGEGEREGGECGEGGVVVVGRAAARGLAGDELVWV